MGWKIIAFIYAFCYLGGVFWTTYYDTTFRIVGGALFFVGLISLFLFAFDKRFLSHRFWKFFTIIYVSYAAVGALLGANTLIAAHGIWTFLKIVALSVVFQFPVLRSLWWLSFTTTQSGPRRFGETAAP